MTLYNVIWHCTIVQRHMAYIVQRHDVAYIVQCTMRIRHTMYNMTLYNVICMSYV